MLAWGKCGGASVQFSRLAGSLHQRFEHAVILRLEYLPADWRQQARSSSFFDRTVHLLRTFRSTNETEVIVQGSACRRVPAGIDNEYPETRRLFQIAMALDCRTVGLLGTAVVPRGTVSAASVSRLDCVRAASRSRLTVCRGMTSAWPRRHARGRHRPDQTAVALGIIQSGWTPKDATGQEQSAKVTKTTRPNVSMISLALIDPGPREAVAGWYRTADRCGAGRATRHFTGHRSYNLKEMVT